MEPIFERKYTVRDCDVDSFGYLTPARVLFFAQDTAGQHCSALALDYDTMAEKRLFWAVIRHRVQITRYPMSGETITVQTWPMPTTRTAYPRATVAYDEKGELLFSSHALWVLMDLNTRAMVLPGKSGVGVPSHLRGLEIPAPGPVPPKLYEENICRHVGFSLLDRNGHMNNTYYLDWVLDLLPGEFHREHPMKSLNICYLAEAREGQDVTLFHHLDEENTLHVEARAGEENAHRVFAVQAGF